MSKKVKTLAEYDAELDALQQQMDAVNAKREQALLNARATVGEIAVATIKAPIDKKECKTYFEAVKKLMDRYSDEFAVLLSGPTVSLKKPVESGSRRLPNEAAANVPTEASVDAEVGE